MKIIQLSILWSSGRIHRLACNRKVAGSRLASSINLRTMLIVLYSSDYLTTCVYFCLLKIIPSHLWNCKFLQHLINYVKTGFTPLCPVEVMSGHSYGNKAREVNSCDLFHSSGILFLNMAIGQKLFFNYSIGYGKNIFISLELEWI